MAGSDCQPFIPGLGQLYAGKLRRACLYFTIYLLCYAVLSSTYLFPLGRAAFLVVIFFPLLWLWGGIDAWRQAGRQHNYILQPYNRWWIYLAVIGIVGLGSFLLGGPNIFSKTTRSFYVPAASMTQTVTVGDYILADAYPARLSAIKRGDVILFNHEGHVFIKRVVAIPGDEVSMTDDILSINGHTLAQKAEVDEQETGLTRDDLKAAAPYREIWPDGRRVLILKLSSDNPYRSFSSVTVPDGAFFVLGDNRDNSVDSRMFGLVPRDQVVGSASFIWWSHHPARIGRAIN
ncbi:MAG TPA: signal peptidase I [Dongiaceae bacterium]|nr:signal peptidase I [Dongiaceae bacterium]